MDRHDAGGATQGNEHAMTRKLLLLPAIAAALLAGCATYGYDYRGGGGGDYYYGAPGYYGNDGYGYPYGYGGYGYPYGYGYPGYGAPYWGGGYYYIPSHHGGSHHHGGHGGRDDDDHQAPPPGQGQQQPDRPRPPWRDLGRAGRAQAASKLQPPAEVREASPPRMRMPVPVRPAASERAPSFPRVGGRKRDAHPIPVP